MKTERNILVAFLLNMLFSVFELVGGIYTGSVAILSDSLHDLGDALSIGAAWLLERKSKRSPDDTHTYGYGRYSVLGSIFTSVILLLGSAAVIYNAACRLLVPTDIDYNGMILFAVVGVVVNLVAAFVTREGDSMNQRAVNLHMLEDVLGWLVVLAGAVIMRFTDLRVLDPILSIGVAVFILVHAGKNLQEAVTLFLEKTPKGVDMDALRKQLTAIEGVTSVHHIHVRSLDGVRHCASLHAVISGDAHGIKDAIRHRMEAFGIVHVTIETEAPGEHCHEEACTLSGAEHHHHHHH
ncbi:MAG: cation transporter [Oscillospiraceae bacterium]|nr:cation transporter [Oscillospiraceae bacterium]